MASIKLDRVTRTFGKKTAVNNVSLEVPDREFLVLLGPSGCGKSTLLRMLAGLESVSSGEIHLDQRRVVQAVPGDQLLGGVEDRDAHRLAYGAAHLAAQRGVRGQRRLGAARPAAR